MMKKTIFMLAMLTCILASCSDGGNEDPVNPTPEQEENKAEITIDSGIISNGLSFDAAQGEQSVSFSTNTDWTLSVASTTSGTTWCKPSATSGKRGSANVKFTVDENTEYDDRSVSVTIKAGTASKTFTITQKGVDALLVTTNKYEVSQEGGTIEVEVKANIDYQMEISESAKDWITEFSGRALTAYKHTFEIALNEGSEKREGEIIFKSGDKVETVKVYQTGGAILLLSQNEFTVSDAGEIISVDVKSNVEYGVQMPDVDWIIDEASSRGMSSHTLKYVIAPNEGYDSRSAEIIFYDKNSDLKDTLKVIQTQKDAIVISQKTYDVKAEGGIVEVKLAANVDFEVTMPEVNWISQTESRTLTEHTLYFKVEENEGEEERSAEIIFRDKNKGLEEIIKVVQASNKTTSVESNLIGLWEVTDDYYCCKKNGKIIDEETEEQIGHRMQFKNNGILLSDWGTGEMLEGIWSYKGSIIHIIYPTGEGDEIATDDLIVVSLTSSELIIEMIETEIEDGNNYEYYEKITMRKITDGDNEANEDILPDNPNAAIVGSWKWIREYGLDNGEEYSQNREEYEIWTFKANGTLIYIDRDEESNNSKWSITGNILTADDCDYTIEVLNEERMVISEGNNDNIEKREFLRIKE